MPSRKPRSLVQRANATQKTLDRYRHRAFDWKTGATCLHLARAQMKAMGHAVPAIPRFSSALGAVKALKSTGHDEVASLIDAHAPRIAPAAMLVGDLALLPGLPPFDQALGVFAGSGALLAWHGDDLSRLVNVVDWENDVIAAWRLG